MTTATINVAFRTTLRFVLLIGIFSLGAVCGLFLLTNSGDFSPSRVKIDQITPLSLPEPIEVVRLN